MQDVYKNIGEYNPGKKRKVLIVFDNMMAQSYFKVPKEVRLNTTHLFITTISNKRELQKKVQ